MEERRISVVVPGELISVQGLSKIVRVHSMDVGLSSVKTLTLDGLVWLGLDWGFTKGRDVDLCGSLSFSLLNDPQGVMGGIGLEFKAGSTIE
jgi:hypothetical protein